MRESFGPAKIQIPKKYRKYKRSYYYAGNVNFIPLHLAMRSIMPSKSRKQHNLMEAAAHDPKFAKARGIPQKVAKEFVAADAKAGKYKGKKK